MMKIILKYALISNLSNYLKSKIPPLFEDGIVTEFNLIARWLFMKKAGVCVINLFFAWAIVFSIKTVPIMNTACDHYLPEHSITESTQTSYSLLKQLYPEPFVVMYRDDGMPSRLNGGCICPKSAEFGLINFDHGCTQMNTDNNFLSPSAEG
jgi:hypothetical protein